MPTLRLLSVDARRFGRDRAALVRAIAAAEPDVAIVHGAPHLLRWRSTCAAIARRSGLVVVTGGRTGAANLLLSSLAVDVTAVRDVRFGPARPGRRAGAALAALRRGEAGFVLAAASLTGNAAERLAQSRQLQRAIDTLVPDAPPSVVCVEGAGRPGTAAWQSLLQNRVNVAGEVFVDARLEVGEVSTAFPPTVVDFRPESQPGRAGSCSAVGSDG